MLIAVFLSPFFTAHISFAQDAAQFESLQNEIKEMRSQFQKIQTTQQNEIESLKTQLKRLNATDKSVPVSALPAQSISGTRAGSSYMNVSFGSAMDIGASTASKPSEQLQLGDHDPQKRGFSLRNAELALDGAVDPYFKGFANIVLKLDENDETEIELEESYLESTSLPYNLQLKAGQFFANFGRQNSQHPHQWSFVDQPIILNRAFGPEGLRSVGTQLSWLMPTSYYSELSLGILDGQGGTAFNFRNPGEADAKGVERFHGRETDVENLHNSGDTILTPRLASSFDLTDTQTLLAGVSGAFGPNSTGAARRTEIYGVDTYWKWKPEDANGGFPFVSWQTEALTSKVQVGADAAAALPAATLKDYGAYSQILWGFIPEWVTGIRADYANGNTGAFDSSDPYRGRRVRVSPVLTYYPSEFSKIRLQYNHDTGEYFSDASSVWMQLEFNLGAHAAHKF